MYTYSEKWKDVFEWADSSILGPKHTYCQVCDRNLSTIARGLHELKRHSVTNKHRRRSVIRDSGSMPCSEVARSFIGEYCESASAAEEKGSAPLACCGLGSRYARDIKSACQHAPYCVYVYGGVTLMSLREGGTVSVVLVGFFDAEAGRHRLRFLDAFQPGGKGGDEVAAAVAKILKDFKLPKENLFAVCSEGNAESSEQTFSHLRELNPKVVALRELNTAADSACRAGLTQLSKQVHELVANIYEHWSSCPTNSNLEALFGSDAGTDGRSLLLNTSCLKLCSTVSKLLEIWSELVLYFKSCSRNDEKAKRIFSQLQDCKLRATFMFLEQALKPLLRFQRRLQTQEEPAGARLQLIAEEASTLLGTYASLFLSPQAADSFLTELDTQILQNKKLHLSSLSAGDRAMEEFLNEYVTEDAALLLTQEALSFYVAVTRCITERLPLSHRALRSVAQLLSPRGRPGLAEAFGILGTELGICSSAQDEGQLADEFLLHQPPEWEEESCPEERWASLLREVRPSSPLRKLLLTLLAFPCPPLEPKAAFTEVP